MKTVYLIAVLLIAGCSTDVQEQKYHHFEKDKYTANRFIIEGASKDGNNCSTPDSYI